MEMNKEKEQEKEEVASIVANQHILKVNVDS